MLKPSFFTFFVAKFFLKKSKKNSYFENRKKRVFFKRPFFDHFRSWWSDHYFYKNHADDMKDVGFAQQSNVEYRSNLFASLLQLFTTNNTERHRVKIISDGLLAERSRHPSCRPHDFIKSWLLHHDRKRSKNGLLKKTRFLRFSKYEFFFDFFKKNLATKKVKNEGFSTPP